MNGEQINTKKDTKNTKNARRLEEEKQLEIHDWSEQSRRLVNTNRMLQIQKMQEEMKEEKTDRKK